MTSVQMQEFGLRYVAQWLERNGYQVITRPHAGQRALVEAAGPSRLLIAVQAAQYPAHPAQLTRAEWSELRRTAASSGRKPMVALVTLALGGPLYREIAWLAAETSSI